MNERVLGTNRFKVAKDIKVLEIIWWGQGS